MKDIFIKIADKDILKELNNIGFDSSYSKYAENKYRGNLYKLFNLKPHEANILKQLCLSLGFDCAVNRETITCKCEYTDCLIFASKSHLDMLVKKLRKQPFRLKLVAELIDEKTRNNLKPLILKNSKFDWSKTYIMGILNVTPDSFSDGGLYNNLDFAIKHCIELIEDGADIIDIGGESTRPGAVKITPEEEINRVIPVINAIRKKNINIPISVDTRNYKTAKAAIDAGADIINDVSGLDYDSDLFEYVTGYNIPVIIMHSDKVPAVAEDFTSTDIVDEIYISLQSKIKTLVNAGVSPNNIIADTGIGFGKSKESCFELLKRSDEFTSLNVPLMLGISRKSFIRNSFEIDYNEADVVTALYSSFLKSFNIHRVHNVKLVKKYLDFTSKIL